MNTLVRHRRIKRRLFKKILKRQAERYTLSTRHAVGNDPLSPRELRQLEKLDRWWQGHPTHTRWTRWAMAEIDERMYNPR